MNRSIFNYCPHCSSEKIEFLNHRNWFCENCGFTYYHNVAGAVSGILYSGLELLLVKRNQEPQKGKFDLPGGFIDPKETAEEALIREIREELNIKIDSNKIEYAGSQPNIYPYNKVQYNTIDLFYTCPIQKEKFNYNKEEIKEVKWLNINDLNINDLAFESQRNFFEKHKKKLLW